MTPVDRRTACQPLLVLRHCLRPAAVRVTARGDKFTLQDGRVLDGRAYRG